MTSPGGQTVGRISIKVTPDTSKFRQELKAQLEAIEKSMKCVIDVEPDLKGFRQRVVASTRNLPKAEVDVDVKRGALDRIKDAVGKLKIEPPNFGSGINPAGYAVILAGITAVAAPLFGLLTSALLTLPGLIAAIATPISALVLGLDGLKNAASVLSEPFNRLKETMSRAAEISFTPVFEKLSALFPVLERSLPSVTQGLADMAQSAIDVITSSGGMSKIEATINNIGGAISRAAPGIGSFTEGLVSLAESFSEKLPNLADWFNNAGKSFSTWIDKITKDGSLSNAFDGLGTTLKAILDTLGKLATEGMKFMSNPENVQTFVTTLQFVGALLTTIVSWSNKAWSALTAVRQTLESMTTTVVGLWSGLSMAATAAWDGLKAVAANALNGVVSTVTSVVSSITGLFNQVPTAFNSAWSSIVGVATGVWNQVVSAVSSALSQIVSAVVNTSAQVVAEVASWPGKIAGALAGLYDIGVNAIKALGKGILDGAVQAAADAALAAGRVMQAIKDMIPNSPAKEGPFSGSGWTNLKSGGASIMEQFGAGLAGTEGDLVNTARAIMQAIKDVFGDASKLNLNFNFGQMATDLQAVADSTAGIRESVSNTVSSGLGSAGSLDDEANKQLKLLQIERDRLNIAAQQKDLESKQAGSKEDRDRLKAEADAIRIQRDQLKLQHDQMKLDQSMNGTLEDRSSLYEQLGRTMFEGPINAMTGFAKDTAGQFMSDIGIGGNGAISNAIEQGVAFGEQLVFNVGSVQEAFTAKQTHQTKKALQYYSR